MARLIQSLQRTHQLVLSKGTILLNSRKQNPSLFLSRLNPVSQITTRNYTSEMRKSAFEGNILRLVRQEIQYEREHSPPKQPITKFDSYTVDERPGEEWIRLKGKYGENEDIKIEATMFDGSIPAAVTSGEGVKLHITLIVNISKGDGEVFEIMCSAWPDSIEIKKLFIRENQKMSAKPYDGPAFKELDDELQDSLYEFLEERGINEKLAVFLHEYMKNKGKTEFIGWMQTVKSYIEQK